MGKGIKNFVIIALGSNLGNREENIFQAINLLRQDEIFDIAKVSSIYQSPALLKEGSPEEWRKDFYNICLSCYCDLTVHEILAHTQSIEREVAEQAKSTRQKNNWSPRYIDIDIISYNDYIIENENLKIPHIEVENRLFVMRPLYEIHPDWKNPRFSETYSLKEKLVNLENISDESIIPKLIKKLEI